jgi:hypothetical protein
MAQPVRKMPEQSAPGTSPTCAELQYLTSCPG